jgi:DNA polymerase-3 subunit epsilon
MDTGVVLDVETTGVNADVDEIIEIGVLEFGLNDHFEASILSMYAGVQEPKKSLSAEITQLTGLTDAILAGRKIDWTQVRQMLERASVVIAHNAEFDAAFVRHRPELQDLDLHWVCSIKHLPWRKMGFRSQSLNYLAADHGFVNPFAHRALFDCATTFRLVAPHLKTLIDRSYEPMFMVEATGAAFETKDILRQNGYRWDAEQRVWKKTVLQCDLEEERAFLEEKIYRGDSRHREQRLSP